VELANAAQAFITDAYSVLRGNRIIPTSVFHPHISVGRDYFGPELSGRQPFQQLESELEAAYPNRFGNPLERKDPEFATTYIFSLLEAAVSRSGSSGDFTAGSDQVSESISEMLDLLDSESDEVVCCRVVSHLTSTSDQPVAIGDVTIVPQAGQFSNSLAGVISKEIPSAPAAFNRKAPTVFDPPHSVIVLRGTTREGSPWDFATSQTQALERFLLGLRLLTGATVRSWYEVSGATTLVARLGPELTTFYGQGHSAIRRTARLDGSEASGIAAINALVESAAVQRDGMVATSFDVAITSFHASYRADEGPYGQLVKLATALEATLASGETDVQGLSLRLRSRAAALLATERDSAESIFSDVGLLYALRSKLVHGSQIKKRDVERILSRLSTMPKPRPTMMLGAPLGHMVDRMRDLVRRGLLARLCLAGEPDPLWPFDPEFSVDMRLSDDENRRKWRDAWRAKLDDLGAPGAAEPPRVAADFLSPQDR
jgi:hypothetical protein